MGKGLRAIIYGLTTLLSVGMLTLTGLASTANASEITNNAYKKQVVEACAKYDNDSNPDVPHACIFGGLGDAGLKYFPQSLDSCTHRPGYTSAEREACQEGAKAGAKAFTKNFSTFSRDAFVVDVQQSCASQSPGSANYDICVKSGAGVSSSPFPHSPDVCASQYEGESRNACNHGVASGNLLMEQYIALGIQPSAQEATGQTPGAPVGGGSGGGTGGGSQEPSGTDQWGNPIYSDPSNGGGSGSGSGSNQGGNTGGSNSGGSNDTGSGNTGGTGDDTPVSSDDSKPGGGDSNSGGNAGQDGDNNNSQGGNTQTPGAGTDSGSGGDSSGGSGSGGNSDGSTGGESTNGSTQGSNNNSTGGSTGSTGSKGSSQKETPDSEHYRPANLGAGKNGPDSSLQNAPVGNSEAHYTNGNGDKMLIKVHRPDNAAARPGIAFVHGGGWRADGGQWDTDFFVQEDPNGPAHHGYVSLRIQYRLMPNGLYHIYHDIRNALEYIQNNAAKLGLDPARIAMWGDSAGGSLTARVAASGSSGLAAAVTMSAPMNAFRDMTWSLPTLAIGLDHTTCLDTGFTSGFNAIGNYIGLGTTPEAILNSVRNMSPAEQLQLAGQVAKDIQGIQAGFESFDWEGEAAKWGVSASDVAEYTTRVPIASTEMKEIEQTYTAEKLTEESGGINGAPEKLRGELTSVVDGLGKDLGNRSTPVSNIASALRSLADSIPGEGATLDANTAQGIAANITTITNELDGLVTALEGDGSGGPSQGLQSVISNMLTNKSANPGSYSADSNNGGANGALQLIAASGLPADQKEALGYATAVMGIIGETSESNDAFSQVARAVTSSGDVGSLISNLAGVAAGHMQNSQAAIITSQLGKCLDDAIQLTPAVFASPSTPPMFMANAQAETVVPPYDATEMQSKLRSFGTRAEAFIIPGTLHMGYDPRAIDPAFNFINSILHPSPVESGGASGGTVSPVP